MYEQARPLFMCCVPIWLGDEQIDVVDIGIDLHMVSGEVADHGWADAVVQGRLLLMRHLDPMPTPTGI